MRTRLALAQALLPQPELLILDEPGDGLDPEGIHEMRETIRRLHREFGMTILFSSHLLNEVEQLCTRICVLHQGQKVFEGALAEATQTRNWVRLNTGDFNAAVQCLQQNNFITGSSEGKFLTLADGVGTERVVKILVEAGLPVFEIAREERTLESFYLKLMQDNAAAPLPSPPKN
jgi:ABC-2 type transport system ATP-binding protein